MDIISTTINYKGAPVKIENGKVYGYAFGTTIYNKKMHYSWCEIPLDKINPDLLKHLKENNLLK